MFFTGKLTTWDLAGYTFICNVWITLYQYFNSCTVAMFLKGLWLDIPWHEPIWQDMASVLKNSSDCSCQEIIYSWHNDMYMVYTRMYIVWLCTLQVHTIMYNMLNVYTWYIHVCTITSVYVLRFTMYIHGLICILRDILMTCSNILGIYQILTR